MIAVRKLRALILLFALAVIFAGGFTVMTAGTADASLWPCCWVMVCPVDGSGPCWEECRPCPLLPPLP
jgi:hypothetical protein